MSDLEIQKKITELENKVSKLDQHLTEHNDTVNKKLTIYNDQLSDTTKQAHDIKHEMIGFGKSFEGFANIFNKNEVMLVEIRDTLLRSNYEARITKFEVFQEKYTQAFYELDMYKMKVANLETAAVVKTDFEAFRIRVKELEDSDDKTRDFKTSVNTVVKILTTIGVAQIAGILIWVFKTFAK